MVFELICFEYLLTITILPFFLKVKDGMDRVILMHRGLAAGCIVSSMCCNLYYGNLENSQRIIAEITDGSMLYCLCICIYPDLNLTSFCLFIIPPSSCRHLFNTQSFLLIHLLSFFRRRIFTGSRDRRLSSADS